MHSYVDDLQYSPTTVRDMAPLSSHRKAHSHELSAIQSQSILNKHRLLSSLRDKTKSMKSPLNRKHHSIHNIDVNSIRSKGKQVKLPRIRDLLLSPEISLSSMVSSTKIIDLTTMPVLDYTLPPPLQTYNNDTTMQRRKKTIAKKLHREARSVEPLVSSKNNQLSWTHTDIAMSPMSRNSKHESSSLLTDSIYDGTLHRDSEEIFHGQDRRNNNQMRPAVSLADMTTANDNTILQGQQHIDSCNEYVNDTIAVLYQQNSNNHHEEAEGAGTELCESANGVMMSDIGGSNKYSHPPIPEDTSGPQVLSAYDVTLMQSIVDARGNSNYYIDKQCRISGPLVYQHEMNIAIVKIQALWRGYACRCLLAAERYFKCNQAAIVIQRCYRYKVSRVRGKMWRERERLRARIDKENDSAIMIQSVWRMYLSRHKVNDIRVSHMRKNAAIIIQKYVRGRQARCAYHLDRSRIVIIQSLIRGYLTRTRIHHMSNSSMMIQRLVRGYLVRKNINRWNMSAIKIQKLYRGYKGRKRVVLVKQEREMERVRVIEYNRQCRSAVTLQRFIRGFLSRLYYKERRVLHFKREVEFYSAEGNYLSNPDDPMALEKYIIVIHATHKKGVADINKLYLRALQMVPHSSVLNMGYAVLLKYLGNLYRYIYVSSSV